MHLSGKLGKLFCDVVRPHACHEIVIATYGGNDHIFNIAIECETCGEVLIDADTNIDKKKKETRNGSVLATSKS